MKKPDTHMQVSCWKNHHTERKIYTEITGIWAYLNLGPDPWELQKQPYILKSLGGQNAVPA